VLRTIDERRRSWLRDRDKSTQIFAGASLSVRVWRDYGLDAGKFWLLTSGHWTVRIWFWMVALQLALLPVRLFPRDSGLEPDSEYFSW